MSPISIWPRRYRRWATPIVVIALLAGSLAPGLAKPVAADGSYTISGIVTGSDGRVLDGIVIDANTVPPYEGQQDVGVDVTHDGGFYSLTVPVSDFTLNYQDFSLTYITGCLLNLNGDFTTDQGNDCGTLHVSGDVTNLNVTMPLGVRITGTVRGSDENPAANIDVKADPGVLGLGAAGATTDINGAYSIAVAPNVGYKLLFQESQDPGSTYFSGCYSSGASGNFSISKYPRISPPYSGDCTTVAVGTSPQTPVPLVVMPLDMLITGTVTDQNGVGLANIDVFAWGSTPLDWYLHTETANDPPGSFSLMVPPDSYAVSFYDPSTTYTSGCYDLDASGNFTADCHSSASVVMVGTSPVTTLLPVKMPPAPAGYTPEGGGVTVTPATTRGPSPVDLNFTSVDSPGTTTLTTSTTGPALPGGYQLAGSSTYYDLETTATYSGSITVCISYAGVTHAPTSLLHYENGAWTDVTTSVDTTSQTICGTTMSLSPFVLATRMAPLTITASGTMTYGGTVPALIPTYSGFVNGDTATSLTIQPTCTTTAASTSPVGTYPITCSGAVDHNYAIRYVAGTLTVAIADRFVTPTNTTLAVAAPGFLALTSAPGASVVISTQPAGKLTLGTNGAFTYVPKAGFAGTDSFAYRLSLGGTLSAPVTVTIYVVGTGMNCTKCNLSGLGMSGANLGGANLSSANLAGTRLDHAVLTGANLSGATLSNATLTYAALTGANLSSAVLSNAALDHAVLTGANLSGATLSNATLTYAALTGANLSKATLTSADLTGANLTGANLAGANLQGATLTGTTVTGVGWSNAVCPDGSNANKDGGTCVGHFNH